MEGGGGKGARRPLLSSERSRSIAEHAAMMHAGLAKHVLVNAHIHLGAV